MGGAADGATDVASVASVDGGIVPAAAGADVAAEPEVTLWVLAPLDWMHTRSPSPALVDKHVPTRTWMMMMSTGQQPDTGHTPQH